MHEIVQVCLYCTTEESDWVVENFGCVIIVIIKFVDQDIIEFSSCFYMYLYIHMYLCVCAHTFFSYINEV